MTYSTYLRERASECISLAVETAGQRGTAALIDLARDYSACASRWERQPAAGAFDRRSPRPWWDLLGWTRH